MRAITLTQPWATLVAIGAKQIETRSWATSYRGPLAIHAGKGLGPVGGKKGLALQCARQYFLKTLDVVMPEHLQGIFSPYSVAERLPLGAIVATCDLKGCIPITEGMLGYRDRNADWWVISDQERAFGDYTPGRFAWLLSNIKALPEPIPAKGALGLWEWDSQSSVLGPQS